MRERLAPLFASVVATGWLAATALDLPLLAAGIAVAAIWAACATAAARRPVRRLVVALTAVAGSLFVSLLLLLGPAAGGVRGLLLQLAVMVVLTPIVPAVYAATFRDGGGRGAP